VFLITSTIVAFALLVGLVCYEFGTLDREHRQDGLERAISAALGEGERVAVSLNEHPGAFAFRVLVGSRVYGFATASDLLEWLEQATDNDTEAMTSPSTLHNFGAVVVSHPSLGN
jgi:hypothetical protein